MPAKKEVNPAARKSPAKKPSAKKTASRKAAHSAPSRARAKREPAPGEFPRREHKGPPNVLFFFTDQQRWDSCGVHGNPLDITPNYDALARCGTHIKYCITPQPVCGPARSVLQSGQYATSTGCFRNGVKLPSDIPTLANSYREAGYHTAYFGKWHLSDHNVVPEEERGGYESWLGCNGLEGTSDEYHTEVYDEEGKAHHLPGYRVDALTDAVIRFLDKGRDPDRPFFCFASYLEPHFQNHRDDYPAPRGYREKYESRWIPPDLWALKGSAPHQLAGYWGMCKRLDEAFGRLLEALHSLDLERDTIIVFTSDHGCHFKTRNGEYKRSGHESSVRVPGVLAGPGFDGGGELTQMVSLIDLPPTLLEACGIDIPDTFQGNSLMPLLRDRQADWQEEAYIQISEAELGRAVRTSRWKYGIVDPTRPPWHETNTTSKYREAYLYDLYSDPYELVNLIGSEAHAPVAERMRERILTRMAEAGEPPAEIVPVPLHPSGQRRIREDEIDA